MKFIIKENQKENINNQLRSLGYAFQGEDNNELSFVKVFGQNGYPRFHLYIKKEQDNLLFNLHLDQRRPVYNSGPAHSGEYDSPIVENEAERVKQLLR